MHGYHHDGPWHFGMRIFKTGLASLICLIFSRALGGYPFFAVIAAIICMKPTIEDSLDVGLHRILGTFIGGLFGMVLLSVYSYFDIKSGRMLTDILTMLGLMVLIKILAYFHRSPATVITCVVYTSILLLPLAHGQSIVQYSMMRVLDTLLGVVVAILVNELLPNHRAVELKKESHFCEHPENCHYLQTRQDELLELAEFKKKEHEQSSEKKNS